MERIAAVIHLILGLLLAQPIAAQTVSKEPATGVTFDTASSDGLTLLGVGVRKMLVVNVYAAALYVDAAGLREAVGSKGLAGVNRALHTGAFKRRLFLHFVRKVPAKKIRAAFKDSLVANMSDADYQAHLASIESFLAACSDVNKGDRFELESVGNKVQVKLRGKTIFTSKAKALTRGMWGSYFGKRPINETLRKDLQQGAKALLENH
jgi:hypothetical protein